jgi:hypothetical protein
MAQPMWAFPRKAEKGEGNPHWRRAAVPGDEVVGVGALERVGEVGNRCGAMGRGGLNRNGVSMVAAFGRRGLVDGGSVW